jgi:hypothetical protein
MHRSTIDRITELISFEYVSTKKGYAKTSVQEFHSKALSVIKHLIDECDASQQRAKTLSVDDVLLAILDLSSAERNGLMTALRTLTDRELLAERSVAS